MLSHIIIFIERVKVALRNQRIAELKKYPLDTPLYSIKDWEGKQ